MSADRITLSVPGSSVAIARVLADVAEERVRQDAKWGRLLTHLFPSPTADAIRAAELPPITGPGAVKRIEKPSRLACTPENRCPTCRALGTLPWSEGER